MAWKTCTKCGAKLNGYTAVSKHRKMSRACDLAFRVEKNERTTKTLQSEIARLKVSQETLREINRALELPLGNLVRELLTSRIIHFSPFRVLREGGDPIQRWDEEIADRLAFAGEMADEHAALAAELSDVEKEQS